MATVVIDTSRLSSVVKLVGVVVSWGVSIYFLWVKNPPAALAQNHFFDQTRHISIVVVSIFLVLSWGLLATPGSVRVVAFISTLATVVGIGIYFWFVGSIQPFDKLTPATAPLLLSGFMAYTTLISRGLTAAVEFIAVILYESRKHQHGSSTGGTDEIFGRYTNL